MLKHKLSVMLYIAALSPALVSANCGRDYHATTSRYGGFFNSATHANATAFAALKSGGSINAWGSSSAGGNGAPADNGYVSIYPAKSAFAALRADGSIIAWGDSAAGGTGEPAGSGYQSISSTESAFAALAADGSISAWGDPTSGGSGAPSGNGFREIFSSKNAFAALDEDGQITAWGDASNGGSGAPSGSDFVSIFATSSAFAAIKADGSIHAWGNSSGGGLGAPGGNGFKTIYSTRFAFAALSNDGSITGWGSGGAGAPAGSGYHSMAANSSNFVALSSGGGVELWGFAFTPAPAWTDVQRFVPGIGFSAIKDDGTVVSWTELSVAELIGQTTDYSPPTGTYTDVVASSYGYSVVEDDGDIYMWRQPYFPGELPTGIGGSSIYSNTHAFVALTSDGYLHSWGDATEGGTGAPTDAGYISVNGSASSDEYNCENILLLGLWEVIEDIAGNSNGSSAGALQINDIDGVHGALSDNRSAYTAALQLASYSDAANPLPAEILPVINAVNTAEATARIVEDIAGNIDGVSTAAYHINSISGVSGAVESNESAYTEAFQAISFINSSAPTATEIQAVIDAVHNYQIALAAVVEDIATNVDGVPASVEQINTVIGINLGRPDLLAQYTSALRDGNYADRNTPRADEVEAIVRAVNDANSPPDTAGLVEIKGITGGGSMDPASGLALALVLTGFRRRALKPTRSRDRQEPPL